MGLLNNSEMEKPENEVDNTVYFVLESNLLYCTYYLKSTTLGEQVSLLNLLGYIWLLVIKVGKNSRCEVTDLKPIVVVTNEEKTFVSTE